MSDNSMMNEAWHASKEIYKKVKKESWVLGICLGLFCAAIFFLNIFLFNYVFIVPSIICIALLFSFSFSHLGLKYGVSLKAGHTFTYSLLLIKPPFKGTMSFWKALLRYILVSIVGGVIAFIIAIKIPQPEGITTKMDLINQMKGYLASSDISAFENAANEFIAMYGETISLIYLPFNVLACLIFMLTVSYSSLKLYYLNATAGTIGNYNIQEINYCFKTYRKPISKLYFGLNFPIILLFIAGNVLGFFIVRNSAVLDYSYYPLIMSVCAALFVTPFLPMYLCNQEAIFDLTFPMVAYYFTDKSGLLKDEIANLISNSESLKDESEEDKNELLDYILNINKPSKKNGNNKMNKEEEEEINKKEEKVKQLYEKFEKDYSPKESKINDEDNNDEK